MTQMGLEYMKLKESQRHNVADEDIRTSSNVITQQDADTRKYTASFKPQEVAAGTMQAMASQTQAGASKSQAQTAAGRLSLDSNFRERETLAKEKTAEASSKQAESSSRQADASNKQADAALQQAIVAGDRNQIENMKVLLSNLPDSTAAFEASKAMGYSSVENALAAVWKLLEHGVPAMFKSAAGGVPSE